MLGIGTGAFAQKLYPKGNKKGDPKIALKSECVAKSYFLGPFPLPKWVSMVEPMAASICLASSA